MHILSYFRSPFPSREGFSAYRMPGGAVHVPFILGSLLIGFLFCWPHVLMRPLMIVWFLAGLYLGRDVAILCHYSPLLSLIVWALEFFVLVKAVAIARLGAAHPLIGAAVSGALAVALFVVARAATREEASVSRPSGTLDS